MNGGDAASPMFSLRWRPAASGADRDEAANIVFVKAAHAASKSTRYAACVRQREGENEMSVSFYNSLPE